jgi:hypothetical protein
LCFLDVLTAYVLLKTEKMRTTLLARTQGEVFFQYWFLEKKGRLIFESLRINMMMITRSSNC